MSDRCGACVEMVHLRPAQVGDMSAGLDGSTEAPFGLSADRQGTRAIVSLVGELDLLTAPQLRSAARALLACGVSDFVLDFEQVSFCDSSGLRVLVELVLLTAESQGSVALRDANDQMIRLLEVTGLDGIVSVSDVRV